MRVEIERTDLATKLATNQQDKKETKSDLEFFTVLCLDSSGSMRGAKYNSALKGILSLIKDINAEDSKGAIIEFSSTPYSTHDDLKMIKFQYHLQEILNPHYYMTAIRDTLELVYNTYIKNNENKNLRFLINIFTDGQDNASRLSQGAFKDLVTLIESLGHTVSFMGTDEDKSYILDNLKIDVTNVLSYANNSAGVAEAFNTTRSARQVYKKALSAGEDTSRGFYSKVLKK